MADVTTVLGVAGAGVGVHFVTDISKGNPPFNHLLAGGVLMGLLAFVSLINVDLALAFAALFLITAFVNNSDPIAKVLNGLSAQKKG